MEQPAIITGDMFDVRLSVGAPYILTPYIYGVLSLACLLIKG